MRRGSAEDGLRYASRKRGKIKLTRGDFGAPLESKRGGRTSRTPLEKRLLGWGEGVLARLHHAGIFATAEVSRVTTRHDLPKVGQVAQVSTKHDLPKVGQPGHDNDGHRLALSSDQASGALLVLAIGSRGVDARVEISEERTFRSHMVRHARELYAALEALPEQLTIGPPKDHLARPARDTTLDELIALLEKPGPLRIGWRVPVETALEHSDVIDEQLEDAIVVLAPIVKIAEAARDRRDATAPSADVANVDTKAIVERGSRVQVLEGPFVGKVGVVQELDGKGGARVMLGLLAAHLEVKILAVASGKRPVLGSSHRRPVMPAGRKVR
ncbi:MAG: KOW motif-containing protein [Polyangiaceae bacterium]